MNETDNNVTGYIIQMIQQQAELCGGVMMLSIWRSMKMQPFTPRGHGMRTYMTPLCMRLVLPGKGRGRVGCEALQKDRRTVNMHVDLGFRTGAENCSHTRTMWSISAGGVLYQSTEEYMYSFRDYETLQITVVTSWVGVGGFFWGGALRAD